MAFLISDCSWGFVSPIQYRSHYAVPPSAAAAPFPTSRVIAPSRRSAAVYFSENNKTDDQEDHPSLRTRLRNLTGFSFTALRATLRATTGISLTAIRVAVGAATSKVVTNIMKTVVGIFPTWFRYFLQPFLILYYTPLMIIRSMVGPTKTFWKDERATHETFVEGWKNAVDAAEKAQEGGYWPVHVNKETGRIETVRPPDPAADEDVDVVDAVAESVEVAKSNTEEKELLA